MESDIVKRLFDEGGHEAIWFVWQPSMKGPPIYEFWTRENFRTEGNKNVPSLAKHRIGPELKDKTLQEIIAMFPPPRAET